MKALLISIFIVLLLAIASKPNQLDHVQCLQKTISFVLGVDKDDVLYDISTMVLFRNVNETKIVITDRIFWNTGSVDGRRITIGAFGIVIFAPKKNI